MLSSGRLRVRRSPRGLLPLLPREEAGLLGLLSPSSKDPNALSAVTGRSSPSWSRSSADRGLVPRPFILWGDFGGDSGLPI